MLAATYPNSPSDGLNSIIGKAFTSIGEAFSIENRTAQVFKRLTKNYREILADLSSISENLSKSDGDAMSQKREFLIFFSSFLGQLAAMQEAALAKESSSSKVYMAAKEFHGVVIEILDKIDSILVAIDLLSDNELPKVLEKFHSGDYSGFERHDD